MRRVLCRLSNANGARRTVITGSRLECLSMYELNPGASATTSTSSFVHSAEAVTFTPLKRTETSDIAFKIETLATLTTELAYDLPENLTRKASLAKLMIKEGKCTIQEVVEFAEVCCRRKLKQPLLDILLDLKLDDDTDANEVAQLLRIMGSTELYPATIFDWIYERIDRLDCRGMSTFLYECGRHGLRCKHFADRAVPRAAKMVPDMSVEEVMRTTQGLIRFIRDWRGPVGVLWGSWFATCMLVPKGLQKRALPGSPEAARLYLETDHAVRAYAKEGGSSYRHQYGVGSEREREFFSSATHAILQTKTNQISVKIVPKT